MGAGQHDSRGSTKLTQDESGAVIADSAYASESRRAALRGRGVIDGIIYKRQRGQAELRPWQERWNAAVSRLRARVEHLFGMIKHQLGYRRAHYCGRKRNELDFALTLAACNPVEPGGASGAATRDPGPTTQDGQSSRTSPRGKAVQAACVKVQRLHL